LKIFVHRRLAAGFVGDVFEKQIDLNSGDRHGFASANNQHQTHVKSETVQIIPNNYRDLRTHDSKMIVGTNLKAPITPRPKPTPL
jgi:hypothetical protein